MAYLNRHGFIDAVVTDNSDALVFGAKCVLKRCGRYCVTLLYSFYFLSIKHGTRSSKAVDMVEVYRIEDISSSRSVGLNDGGLLLYALLSGGDYSVSDRFLVYIFQIYDL